MNTNLNVSNEYIIEADDSSLIEEGSLYSGLIDGKQVNYPEKDIDISQEINSVILETDVDSIEFDSIYFSVTTLESVSLGNTMYTPTSIYYLVENLNIDAKNFSFLAGEYYMSMYIFEPVSKINLADMSLIGQTLYGSGPTYNDIFDNPEVFEDISSMSMFFLGFENVLYSNKIDSNMNLNSKYFMLHLLEIYSSREIYSLLSFYRYNPDYHKLGSVEYNFTFDSGSNSVRIGRNRLEVK